MGQMIFFFFENLIFIIFWVFIQFLGFVQYFHSLDKHVIIQLDLERSKALLRFHVWADPLNVLSLNLYCHWPSCIQKKPMLTAKLHMSAIWSKSKKQNISLNF